jgi:hypothetical protein
MFTYIRVHDFRMCTLIDVRSETSKARFSVQKNKVTLLAVEGLLTTGNKWLYASTYDACSYVSTCIYMFVYTSMHNTR